MQVFVLELIITSILDRLGKYFIMFAFIHINSTNLCADPSSLSIHPYETLVWRFFIVEKNLLLMCPPEVFIKQLFVDFMDILSTITTFANSKILALKLWHQLAFILSLSQLFFSVGIISFRIFKKLFQPVLIIFIFNYGMFKSGTRLQVNLTS